MADLNDFRRLVAIDRGLAVVATLRADHTVQASVVNAGVVPHPLTRSEVVGFVALGRSRKLANLRARDTATVVVRAGWEWVAVEGRADLVGPDDDLPGVDQETVRRLLREVFRAAGGTHDDWDTYDRVVAEERRTAVLIVPDRIYSNRQS